LIVKKIQVSLALKNTYILSNYAYYDHSISTLKYEINLNTILTLLVSNVFSSYSYDTKVVQILDSTSHKLNANDVFFNILLQDIFNLLSCVHIKKMFHFYIELWAHYFLLSILPCQHPKGKKFDERGRKR
jgi:hypothetical protein